MAELHEGNTAAGEADRYVHGILGCGGGAAVFVCGCGGELCEFRSLLLSFLGIEGKGEGMKNTR